MSRPCKYDDSRNEEIVSLYNNGLSMRAVGREVGMPVQVIKRKLEKMGSEIRNRIEAMKLHHEKRKND